MIDNEPCCLFDTRVPNICMKICICEVGTQPRVCQVIVVRLLGAQKCIQLNYIHGNRVFSIFFFKSKRAEGVKEKLFFYLPQTLSFKLSISIFFPIKQKCKIDINNHFHEFFPDFLFKNVLTKDIKLYSNIKPRVLDQLVYTLQTANYDSFLKF